MDYAFKPTTNGRAVITACMALKAPLDLTRVAVGSGRVAKDTDLADVHQLLHYEAEGSVGERRHENDRFYLTVQYSNRDNPDVPTFLLSEFIVYARHPATGEIVDFLYATLGDYVQSVPPCSMDFPAAVWNFPLTMVLSDEIDVFISAPAGLVTYDELTAIMNRMAVRQLDILIPAAGWTTDGAGTYPCRLDMALDAAESMIPMLTVLPQSTADASDCGLAPFAQTLDGTLRLWAERVPQKDIHASLALLRDSSGLTLVGGALLTPATPEQIGGVKVGPGLNVTEDGTLSVDMASEEDVAQMLDETLSGGKAGEEG